MLLEHGGQLIEVFRTAAWQTAGCSGGSERSMADVPFCSGCAGHPPRLRGRPGPCRACRGGGSPVPRPGRRRRRAASRNSRNAWRLRLSGARSDRPRRPCAAHRRAARSRRRNRRPRGRPARRYGPWSPGRSCARVPPESRRTRRRSRRTCRRCSPACTRGVVSAAYGASRSTARVRRRAATYQEPISIPRPFFKKRRMFYVSGARVRRDGRTRVQSWLRKE